MKGKKFWALLLSVCLIVSSIGVISVVAEPGEVDVRFSVTTDKQYLKAGDEVTLTMSMDKFKSTLSGDNTPSVTTMEFLIPIDPDVFEYVDKSMTNGLLTMAIASGPFAGKLKDCNFTDEGLKVAAAYGLDSVLSEDNARKELFSFKLKVKDTVNKDTEIKFGIAEGAIFKNITLSSNERYSYESVDSTVQVLTNPVLTVDGSTDIADSYKTAVEVAASQNAEITVNNVTQTNPCTVSKRGTYKVVAKNAAGLTAEKTFKIEPVVESIKITTEPTVKEYVKGSTLDVTGGVIEATLSNGETDTVTMTAEMVSGFNSNPETFGKQTLTVTYEGKTATYDVTVKDKAVKSVEWATKPAPTIIEEQDLSEALKDAKIKVVYDDETTDSGVAVTEAMCSGFDNTKLGAQTVTVTIGEKTLTFNITVVAKTLTGIEVKAPEKVAYIENQDLDLTGMIVTAKYDNGKIANVTEKIAPTDVTGYNNQKLGEQTITVSYTENTVTMTDSFEVSVRAKELVSVSVKTKPAGATVKVNNDLVLTGGVLTATYDNGQTADIDMTDPAVKVSGFDKTKVGEQTVTLSYTERDITESAEMVVNVLDKAIVSVTLTTAPTEATVLEGKELQFKDGELTVVYDNGTEEKVSLTDTGITVSGLDTNTPGEQDVTLEYKGVNVVGTVKVTVVAKSVKEVKVTTLPTKTTYIENMNDFTSEGGKLTVYYDNDTEKVVDFSDASVNVTPADTTKVGKQDVTVTYTEGETTKTTTYEITVAAKQLAAISVDKKPSKLSIVEGQKLDVTDGILKVTYDNNETKTIPMTNEMISGFDTNKVGTQTVTVSYTENGVTKETQLTVEVAAKEVTGVELVSAPAATTVKENMKLDLTGGVIKVTYNDGDVQNMDITEAMINLDTNIVGPQTVTVTYAGKEAGTFDVEVLPKQEIGITLEIPKEIVVESELKPVVKIIYDNETDAVLAAEDYEISGFDATKLGLQTVTAAYKEFNATADIVVLAKSEITNTVEGADNIYATVDTVVEEDTIKAAENALNALEDAYANYKLYRLNLLDKNSGVIVDNSGLVKVTVPLPDTMKAGNKIKVFLMNGDKLVELAATVVDNQVTFTTEQGGEVILAEYVVEEPAVPGEDDSEKKPAAPGEKDTTGNTDNKGNKVDTDSSVKTGDSARVAVFMTIICIAGAGFALTFRKRENTK